MFNKICKKKIKNKNKNKNTKKNIFNTKSKRLNLKGGANAPKDINSSIELNKILDELSSFMLPKQLSDKKIPEILLIIEKLEEYKKLYNLSKLITYLNNLNVYLQDCQNAYVKIQRTKNNNGRFNYFVEKIKLEKTNIIEQIQRLKSKSKSKSNNESSLKGTLKSSTRILPKTPEIPQKSQKPQKPNKITRKLPNPPNPPIPPIPPILPIKEPLVSPPSFEKKSARSEIKHADKDPSRYEKKPLFFERYDSNPISNYINFVNFGKSLNGHARSGKEPASSATGRASYANGYLSSPYDYENGHASSAKGSATGHARYAKEPATGHARSGKEPATGHARSGKEPANSSNGRQELIPPTIFNHDFNHNNKKKPIEYNTKLLRPDEIEKIKADLGKKLHFPDREYIPIDQTIYTAFTNVGSSCYLNSAIQFLFAIPEFRDIIRGQPNNNNVIHTLQTLLHFFESNKGKVLSIDDVREKYKELTDVNVTNTKQMNKDIERDLKKQTIYEQLFIGTKYHSEDTGEFFLEKIFLYIAKNPMFIDLFGFNPTEEITCMNDQKFKKNFLHEGEFEKTLQIELYNETDKDEIQVKILKYIAKERESVKGVLLSESEKVKLLSLKQDIDDTKTHNLQTYINELYNSEVYVTLDTKVTVCERDSNPEGKAKSHKIISFNTKKYIIIFIKRFFSILQYDNDIVIGIIKFKIQFKVVPNPKIIIDYETHNKAYRLKSCIIHVGDNFEYGHYVYLNFDVNGFPLHIIDDSVVYNYDGQIDESHDYIRNGYFYLYEEIR